MTIEQIASELEGLAETLRENGNTPDTSTVESELYDIRSSLSQLQNVGQEDLEDVVDFVDGLARDIETAVDRIASALDR